MIIPILILILILILIPESQKHLQIQTQVHALIIVGLLDQLVDHFICHRERECDLERHLLLEQRRIRLDETIQVQLTVNDFQAALQIADTFLPLGVVLHDVLDH